MLTVVVFTPENQTSLFPTLKETAEFFSESEVSSIVEKLWEQGENAVMEPDGHDLMIRLKEHQEKSGECMQVFNLSYGKYGRARYTHLPSACEAQGVPYTGNSPLPHALCLDKSITKKLVESCGVKTPKGVMFDQDTIEKANHFLKQSNFSRFILKPVDDAGSLDLKEVGMEDDLLNIIEPQVKYLLEEKLVGQEIHQPFVKGLDLPPVKINLSPGEIYTQKVKEQADASLYSVVSDELAKKSQEVMGKIVSALFIDGYCRADMMLVEGELYLIEVNSHASLKEKGALRFSAEASGVSEAELFKKILDTAYKSDMLKTQWRCECCEQYNIVVYKLQEGAFVSQCQGAINGECSSPFLHDPVDSPRDCLKQLEQCFCGD